MPPRVAPVGYATLGRRRSTSAGTFGTGDAVRSRLGNPGGERSTWTAPTETEQDGREDRDCGGGRPTREWFLEEHRAERDGHDGVYVRVGADEHGRSRRSKQPGVSGVRDQRADYDQVREGENGRR